MDTFSNTKPITESMVISSQVLEDFRNNGPHHMERQHLDDSVSMKAAINDVSQVSMSPNADSAPPHLASAEQHDQNTLKLQAYAQLQSQKQPQMSTLQSSTTLPQQFYNGSYPPHQKKRSPASQGKQMNLQAELQDSYGILQQQHPNISTNSNPNLSVPSNGNFPHVLGSQLSHNTLAPQPNTHARPPTEDGAPNSALTPQVAAAIMGDRGNVSQRQMAQLQQLQATYGSLQTHLSINKQSEPDELQSRRSTSVSFSPGKTLGAVAKLQKENTLSSSDRGVDNFSSVPASLAPSITDINGKQTDIVGYKPQMQSHMATTLQGNQRKFFVKPQGFSSQSSRVTTPFQDSFGQNSAQQSYFNPQIVGTGQPVSSNAVAPQQQHQYQNRPQQHQQHQQHQPQLQPQLPQQHHSQFNPNGQYMSSQLENGNYKVASNAQHQPQPQPQSQQHQPQRQPQFSGQPFVPSYSNHNLRPQEQQGSLSEEVRRNLSNISIVRLLRFHDLLTCRHEKPNLPYLRHVVGEFFAEDATYDICLKYGNENRNFRISYSLIPLLYYKYLENVQMFELAQKFLSSTLLPNGNTLIETDHFSFKCVFEDGSYCNHFGSLKIRVNRHLMFEKVELVTDYNVYGLEFAALETFLDSISAQDKISTPLSSQVRSHFKCISDLTKFGMEEDLLRLMQISDVMTLTKPLINFYFDSKLSSPLEALETFNKINYPMFQKLSAVNTKGQPDSRDTSSENSAVNTVIGPNVAMLDSQNGFVSQRNSRPNPFPTTLNYNGSSMPAPANVVQLSQQNGQISAQIRTHQESISSSHTPKTVTVGPIIPSQLSENLSRSMLPSPDTSYSGKSPFNLTNMGNNNGNGNHHSVPLKQSTSEGNTISQVVSRKAGKKFKLQAPPAPKTLKKRKASSVSNDERNLKETFIKKEGEPKIDHKGGESSLSIRGIREDSEIIDMNKLNMRTNGESMNTFDSSNSNSLESELGNDIK